MTTFSLREGRETPKVGDNICSGWILIPEVGGNICSGWILILKVGGSSMMGEY